VKNLYTAAVIGSAILGGLTIQGCEVTYDPPGTVILRPATGKPVKVPNKRVRQITYKGKCLETAGDFCWPCGGGTAMPCIEWYEIIDTAGELTPDNDGSLGNMVQAMLDQDNVEWDYDAIMAAYDLNDLGGQDDFLFRVGMRHFNTDTEEVDLVFFGRDDFVSPDIDAGARIQAMILASPTVPPVDYYTPVAYRVTGTFDEVKLAMEPVLPVGSQATYTNEYGEWTLTAVDDGGQYAIDVYQNGGFFGTW